MISLPQIENTTTAREPQLYWGFASLHGAFWAEKGRDERMEECEAEDKKWSSVAVANFDGL